VYLKFMSTKCYLCRQRNAEPG